MHCDYFEPGLRGFLEVLKSADNDSVKSLVGEILREKDAVRADAPTKHVFDGRWREIERWLLHDEWAIENGQLVRLTPEAEEATDVRDKLIEEPRKGGQVLIYYFLVTRLMRRKEDKETSKEKS